MTVFGDTIQELWKEQQPKTYTFTEEELNFFVQRITEYLGIPQLNYNTYNSTIEFAITNTAEQFDWNKD